MRSQLCPLWIRIYIHTDVSPVYWYNSDCYRKPFYPSCTHRCLNVLGAKIIFRQKHLLQIIARRLRTNAFIKLTLKSLWTGYILSWRWKWHRINKTEIFRSIKLYNVWLAICTRKLGNHDNLNIRWTLLWFGAIIATRYVDAYFVSRTLSDAQLTFVYIWNVGISHWYGRRRYETNIQINHNSFNYQCTVWFCCPFWSHLDTKTLTKHLNTCSCRAHCDTLAYPSCM